MMIESRLAFFNRLDDSCAHTKSTHGFPPFHGAGNRFLNFVPRIPSFVPSRQKSVILCFLMPNVSDHRKAHRLFIQTLC